MTKALQQSISASTAGGIPWQELAEKIPLVLHFQKTDSTFDSHYEPYTTDFSHTVRMLPAAVVTPRTVTDVVYTLHFAQQYRIPTALRGAGHAASRLVLRKDGIILDMRSLGAVLEVNADQLYVDVEGGASWASLLQATLPYGLMPSTTVDWQELTVSGTISTGGVGAQSFWAGVHADQVSELDVVSGSGELIRCSPHIETDVFNGVRAGLGQMGAIVRARIPLIQAPQHVLFHKLYYGSVTDLLSDLAVLTRERSFDTLFVFALPIVSTSCETLAPDAHANLLATAASSSTPNWVYKLEAGQYMFGERVLPKKLRVAEGCITTQFLTIEEFLFHAPPLMQHSEHYKSPHIELVLFVPEATVEKFLSETLATLSADDMGSGPLILVPIDFAGVQAPLLQVPTTQRGYMFGLLRIANPPIPTRIDELTAHNLRIYEQAIAAGAIRYPCDSLPLPAISTSRNERLRPLLDRLDPARILTAYH